MRTVPLAFWLFLALPAAFALGETAMSQLRAYAPEGSAPAPASAGAVRLKPAAPRTIVIAERPMAVDTDGPGRFPRDPDHQSQTSYQLRDGSYLDAARVPYVVLPVKKGWRYWEELRSVRLGDFVCVEFAGLRRAAVAGDRGPDDRRRGNFGEGSLFLAQALDPRSDEDNGIEGGVTYNFYPGSNERGTPADQAELLARLKAFAAKAGCDIP